MADLNLAEKAAYSQAVKQSKWIYEPRNKEWFSPAEFERHIDEVGSFQSGTEFEIRDPFQAIIEARQTINGLTHRTNQFEARVFEWCRQNIKKE